MDQSKLEALLGRSLTSNEIANLESYLDITLNAAESLLCMNLTTSSSARTFNAREGYSTVFTDLFQAVSEVKIDGVVSSDYYTAFWDNRNATYKNSLVFDCLDGKEVQITATWGGDLPQDLQILLARAYAQSVAPTAVVNKDVRQKRVEDFSVTYGDLSSDDVFVSENATVIAKYSLCNIGYVKHGKVSHEYRI